MPGAAEIPGPAGNTEKDEDSDSAVAATELMKQGRLCEEGIPGVYSPDRVQQMLAEGMPERFIQQRLPVDSSRIDDALSEYNVLVKGEWTTAKVNNPVDFWTVSLN
uniref:Uncharacterized protein n=1 Tax=Romanomermis culicivorax TaxID=13658 RepID=A0A915INQ0_ROMCU